MCVVVCVCVNDGVRGCVRAAELCESRLHSLVLLLGRKIQLCLVVLLI